MKLTSRAVTDYSKASLYSVCFDIVKRKWRTDNIEQSGLGPDKFPEVFPCDEVIGEVMAEVAERTGLAKGTPVVAGTVDANAAYAAGGAIGAGDFSLAMGTAGCMGVIHKDRGSQNAWLRLSISPIPKPCYSTLAMTVSSGAVTRYFRDTFGQMEKQASTLVGIDVYDMMNMEVQNVPPGSDGVIVLPYFTGNARPSGPLRPWAHFRHVSCAYPWASAADVDGGRGLCAVFKSNVLVFA